MLNGGSLYTFFSQSEVEIYEKMFNRMKSEATFVNSTKEGVQKVREGGFAYLTDGPYLDYYNSREPCNTMMLENLLEAKSYGIALQRNSELTNQFSVAILQVILNEFSNILNKMYFLILPYNWYLIIPCKLVVRIWCFIKV